ncbi:MAG: hypothetical protein ACQEWU_14755 [Bacillota bacterium]|uniref:Uncharacterized protein n=1 Tax=Virgibacillus salarius TaxID=447199 RepID=A0A941DT26_9BACI|nr:MULTISPECIES: hypothetical protein [Virgibacillus]NAZ07917.1 hypothetical protein [Agaribacter marinus]MBR7795201.1 hypothetical protein [Virgibacillus salarius]MCC2251080.1 hypothetical protein [Virgibacillus sp. AGTR]MDY7044556.1 hypothetical protein [Virgibacillus sp. M23]QRZ19917.1 hypothetical protein JUJ52_09935 [Virgibacillus sp. AGTR]
MSVDELYYQIYELKERLGILQEEYWHQTSGPDTWYFWFNIVSVIIPFVLLYFFLDRGRVFEIGFYGFAIHVMWSNLDNVLSMYNYLITPHSISYLFPTSLTVTTVVLPIGFMLLYQYCTNKGKNFYLYAIVLSAGFGYGLASIFIALDMLILHGGMKLTYIFLLDVAISYLAFWLTKLFWWLKNHGPKKTG